MDYYDIYARENKDKLLHTIRDSVIVCMSKGLCTVVTDTGCITNMWAGEVKLK